MLDQTNKSVYDPNTGELMGSSPVVVQNRILKPNLANSRQLETIAGKQAKYINLRDNESMSGRKVAIVRVTQASGDYGDYVKILCFPLDSEGAAESPVVIMTGAENVLDRVNVIMGDCSIETPVIATFEKVGDAWLLN